MYSILNKFLRTSYFDKLPKFLARKIFKIFKIFFVETNLKSLPKNNHPTEIDKNIQLDIIKNINQKFYKPFNTCSFLLEVVSMYNSTKNKLKFFDFGANNLDNYVYLKRYLKTWEYFYHDLPKYNEYVTEFIQNKNLEDIKVIHDLTELDEDIDITFFGSSIHYINNYQEILKQIFLKKSKYIIFSHTPFYMSEKSARDIVMKQVNIHPIINYAYLIEYNNFISLMKQNNYELIAQNKNNFIKFLNFKNFENFPFLSFLDLIFLKKQ